MKKNYTLICMLVVADMVCAIPRDRRLALYLTAYYKNIPSIFINKFHIRMVCDFIQTDYVEEYLSKQANINKTSDIVDLNEFMKVIYKCENENHAFRTIYKASILK